MTKRAKILALTGAVLVLLTGLVFLVPFVAYRNWAFICENTGSHKGHTDWFFGAETKHWYAASPLEIFLKTNAPTELRHKWTSYAGTSYDIYGIKVLHGHGRPGPILQFRTNEMAEWFATIDDREKRAFYDLLVSGEKDAINRKITAIYDQLFERSPAPAR
jgi:hypothetical protein